MSWDSEAESPRADSCAPRIGAADGQQGIGRQARKRIGTHLRAMYETVLSQPVPARFTELIARLEDASPETSPGKDS